MSTLTVRLPDDKHNRLKALAAHKKLSLNCFEKLGLKPVLLSKFSNQLENILW